MTTRSARASHPKKDLPARVVVRKTVGSADGQPDSESASTIIEPEHRRAMIAEAAYYRAQQRGFEPGYELDDWCTAETEIDTILKRGQTPTLCGV